MISVKLASEIAAVSWPPRRVVLPASPFTIIVAMKAIGFAILNRFELFVAIIILEMYQVFSI